MILAVRALGLALASWSRNFPLTHDTSFTCLMVPVLGAVKWLPFSNAVMATQVQAEPCGIPPFSSHHWPFSALEGWLWLVSLAPKNAGVVAVGALPAEAVRPTRMRGATSTLSTLRKYDADLLLMTSSRLCSSSILFLTRIMLSSCPLPAGVA